MATSKIFKRAGALSVFLVVLALHFTPLVFGAAGSTTILITPLPGVDSVPTGDTGLANYINAIFTYGIGLAALIAMAQLIFGAVQYTASAGAPSLQEDAKGRMRGAIIGLVLLILSTTILLTLSGKSTKLGLSDLEQLVDQYNREDKFKKIAEHQDINARMRLSGDKEVVNQMLATLGARVGSIVSGGTTLDAIRETFGNPETPIQQQKDVMNWLQSAWNTGAGARVWSGAEYAVLEDVLIESYSSVKLYQLDGTIQKSDFDQIVGGLSSSLRSQLEAPDPFGRNAVPIDQKYIRPE